MAGLITTLRPRTFDEVIAHREQVKAIKALLSRPRDQIPQAWLFSGPPGVGKTTLARIVARQLGASPTSLVEINVGQDKGIQMVRELTSRLHYLPPGASVLAIILDEAHELTEAAKNALLKPIEEPPSHVFWFLCTTDPAAMSEAILTRCVQFELRALSIPELQEVVLTAAERLSVPISEQELLAIAQAAEGSARTALAIFDRVKDFVGKPEFFTLVQHGVTAVKADLSALLQALANKDKSFLQKLPLFKSIDWKSFSKALLLQAADLVVQGNLEHRVLSTLLKFDFENKGYPALVAAFMEVIYEQEAKTVRSTPVFGRNRPR